MAEHTPLDMIATRWDRLGHEVDFGSGGGLPQLVTRQQHAVQAAA